MAGEGPEERHVEGRDRGEHSPAWDSGGLDAEEGAR